MAKLDEESAQKGHNGETLGKGLRYSATADRRFLQVGSCRKWQFDEMSKMSTQGTVMAERPSQCARPSPAGRRNKAGYLGSSSALGERLSGGKLMLVVI